MQSAHGDAIGADGGAGGGRARRGTVNRAGRRATGRTRSHSLRPGPRGEDLGAGREEAATRGPRKIGGSPSTRSGDRNVPSPEPVEGSPRHLHAPIDTSPRIQPRPREPAEARARTQEQRTRSDSTESQPEGGDGAIVGVDLLAAGILPRSCRQPEGPEADAGGRGTRRERERVLSLPGALRVSEQLHQLSPARRARCRRRRVGGTNGDLLLSRP